MRSLLFLLIACLSLVLLVYVSEKFKLRSKLEKDSKFKFSVFMRMKVERKGEEPQMFKMESESRIDCDASVKKSDERKGESIIENKATRIRVKGDLMGMEFEYDSDKDRKESNDGEEFDDPDQAMARMLRRLIGKKFRLKVTERWAMEMAESDAEFAGMPFPATTHLLPNSPVAVGDKWEAESKTPLTFGPGGEPIKAKLILTLKSVDDGVAIIGGRFKKVKGAPEIDIEKSSFGLRFNIEGGYPEKVVMKLILKEFGFLPAPPGGDGERETSAELTVEYSMKPKTEEKETKEKKEE